MQKRQILINGVMSVLQTIVITTILFILYKFLLNVLGVERLGIWSLVLATTSVTQIANLGLTGSVVKFVAKYIARGKKKNVSAVIQTAVLSVALFVGLTLLIGHPIAKWALELIVPYRSLPSAIAILPHALLAIWIVIITSILQAGIDGHQRIDIRSTLLMGGAAFHLFLCFIFAPKYGLLGIAYARVIQSFAMLLSSWFFLKRLLPILPIVPYKWNKRIFREIIGYSLNFQIISLTTMFYDPVTKALLSKFGGLSMVGFYEMASRMLQQFRALIVSASQVLIPAISDLKETLPEKIPSLYLSSYQLILYISLPLYSLVIISSPLISELWVGHYERLFVAFATWLAIGWFLNTLATPAYFVNLGTGKLFWNVTAHIVIGILNAGLGILLGLFYNGMGVIIAWIIALALGSSMIYLSYHIIHNIPLIDLFPKSNRIIVIACAISIFISRAFSQLFDSLTPLMVNSAITFFSTIIIFAFLWVNPMRKRITEWINPNLFVRKLKGQGINS